MQTVKNIIENYNMGLLTAVEMHNQLIELALATKETIANGTSVIYEMSGGYYFAIQDGVVHQIEISAKITQH